MLVHSTPVAPSHGTEVGLGQWGPDRVVLAGEAQPPDVAGPGHHLEARAGPLPLVRWRAPASAAAPACVRDGLRVVDAPPTPRDGAGTDASPGTTASCRGRSNHEGSEHYLEGEQYPLELHFVHVNTKYNNGDINAALASGSPDALLVVGQMFKVGASQSSSMDEIAAGIASGDVAVARSIVASDLMDTGDGYYTYPGSLTTPTCNPVVTWVVLASAIDVTEVCLRACTSYRA